MEQTMKYYPISLDISNRRCVVVGGGEVAERKVCRLLDSGAEVTVVSETFTPALRALGKDGKIRLIARAYAAPLIEGAFLVFGTTDDEAVNEAVFRDARQKNIPVNIADDPKRCDFILPSLLEEGSLQIAVSTGGKSPALARRIRLELEALYGPEYAPFLEILGELRKRVLSKGLPQSENKEIFDALIRSEILEKIRGNEWDGVGRLILKITGEKLNLEKYK
jgi:precorrin-2 dehydrogenase/sirohydrochlorin ferrochelatase